MLQNNKKNILVMIDMQNSFIHPQGKLYIKNSERLIQDTNDYLKNISKDFFDCVIYTQDTHFAKTYNQYEEAKHFPLHCEFNTWDWELALSTELMDDKIKHIYTLHKDTYDMWNKPTIDNNYDLMYKLINHKTKKPCFNSVDELLQSYPIEHTNIYLLGVASDYCNKYAIVGFLQRNYKVHILQNLTEGIEKNTIITIENDNFLCYCINNDLLYIVD